MTVLDDVQTFNAVLTGKADNLGEGFTPLEPRTPEAEDFLAALTIERLYLAADEMLEGRHEPLRRTVEALLEHLGHQESVQGRPALALRAIERLHSLRPDHVGIRMWLAGALGESGDPNRIVELYEPLLAGLVESPESYSPYFPSLVAAAARARRIDVLATLAASLPFTRIHADMRIDVASRRGVDLRDAGIEVTELRAMSGRFGDALASAMLALDEYSLLEKIQLCGTAIEEAGVPEIAIRHALVLSKLAWTNGWSRAYRESLHLAARLGSVGTSKDALEKAWHGVGLPSAGFAPFGLVVNNEKDGASAARHAFEEASQSFERNPCLETAERVWDAAYQAGGFAKLAYFAPSTTAFSGPGGLARTLVYAEKSAGGGAPLWVLVPWLKGADRLLRVLAAYVGHATTVVTVGGDGVPSDLNRLSNLLLTDRAHILSRPVVSWGGQRGVHYNMFEVLDVFLEQAPSEAWLQIACDKSYPTLPLQRIALRAATNKVRLQQSGTGPPSWDKEWPQDVVQTLPQRYHSALEEGFRTGLAKEFAELATKSPYYGDNDSRLYPTIFNFSPQAVSADSSSWHNYMVSGFEVDVRWMSFARLQAFVDVSTETRTTFARRHHPTVTKWVHQVLSKYDLRTGSPWVFISHNYVKTALNHPDFPELYSALDLGFAPEMNFFDTVAASFDLADDFHHTYHVFPGQSADDAQLPAACVSADRDGLAFIRKTDPETGAELLRLFPQPLFAPDSVDTLHWVTAYGPARAEDYDPRPRLDARLVDRLSGARVCIRDLLGRVRKDARFMPDGRIVDVEGSGQLAGWTFSDNVLTVAYADPAKGVKSYSSIGGGPRSLTLAPAEIVYVGNGWGTFLDFNLEDLHSDPAVVNIAHIAYEAALGVRGQWIGAGLADTSLLAALSDPERSSFPTPTIQVDGCIHEFRTSDAGLLALATLDGMPSLLTVKGFAQTRSKCVLELERAGEAELSAWRDFASTEPVQNSAFTPDDIAGLWTLTTLYGEHALTFHAENWIVDATGAIAGRWFAREDGVQLVGLPGLVFGLADQFRLNRGAWRLSGWAWLNMKDAVTFSLSRSR